MRFGRFGVFWRLLGRTGFVPPGFDPTEGLDAPRPDPAVARARRPASQPRPLTFPETVRIAAHLHPVHQLVLWLQRVMGLRISEAFGVLSTTSSTWATRSGDESGQLSFREAFENAAAAEGLGPRDLGFPVSPHLLRKSVATDLVWQPGIEDAARRRFMAHRAADDVYGRVYTLDHPELTPLEALARVLDEIIRGSTGSLLVPTTRRIRWGHSNRYVRRACHVEATLGAAGWM
jgi:hypothetical protein